MTDFPPCLLLCISTAPMPVAEAPQRTSNGRLESGAASDVFSRPALLEGAASGQWPYAAVLSCIDSRAPVEQIFDAEIGDLFVARVAGNVASPELIASLEYTTKYAGARAVLVLGHTKCGAVKGAWAGLEDGRLTGLLARIEPAVSATKRFQAAMAVADKTAAGLERAFKAIDADGNGAVSIAELRAHITTTYAALDEQVLADMMAAADTNQDGELNLEEFMAIMRAGPEKMEDAIAKPSYLLT